MKYLQSMQRHIILLQPQIHWNTGAIGRTCLGFDTHLHLVKPLGFSLDEKQVKRAGLDYWTKVQLSIWNDFEQLIQDHEVNIDELFLFSRFATIPVQTASWSKRSFLVFGSETSGIKDEIKEKYKSRLYTICTTDEIRSLNLATSVGIGLYESIRTNFN